MLAIADLYKVFISYVYNLYKSMPYCYVISVSSDVITEVNTRNNVRSTYK